MTNKLITEFQDLENELNSAYERNDLSKIREMLSEEWYIVESASGLSAREEFLLALESGTLVQTKMKKQVKKVTLVDNLAIVLSRGMNEGTFQGHRYSAEQWVTDMFENDGNGWRCVMTQETPLSNCPE
jgi:hypothetical protein